MKYIHSNSKNPYFNLALEEYTFDQLSSDEDVFMLWQNSPSIIVGRYQNTAQEINQKFVDDNEIKVVRRLSGGGAVYHDEGNLNFTFIVKQNNFEKFQFEHFVNPLIRTLKKMGVNAEFTGRNDVTIDGKKICGNSQYMHDEKIMHHGCIMVSSDLNKLVEALRPKKAKYTSNSTKSVPNRVTTIREHVPNYTSVDSFKEMFLKEIFRNEKINRYVLSNVDLLAIASLEGKKYMTWDWNYGKCGDYNYQKTQQFWFGTVELEANVKGGIIEDIHISGDFFGNGDIKELEEAMRDLRIDEDMTEMIENRICVGNYIHGMTAKLMQEMLR